MAPGTTLDLWRRNVLPGWTGTSSQEPEGDRSVLPDIEVVKATVRRILGYGIADVVFAPDEPVSEEQTLRQRVEMRAALSDRPDTSAEIAERRTVFAALRYRELGFMAGDPPTDSE